MKMVLKLNSIKKRFKQRKSCRIYRYSEREKIQALNELKCFEKNHSLSHNASKNAKVLANKVLGRFQVRITGTYEERKQRLIDSIIQDIQKL